MASATIEAGTLIANIRHWICNLYLYLLSQVLSANSQNSIIQGGDRGLTKKQGILRGINQIRKIKTFLGMKKSCYLKDEQMKSFSCGYLKSVHTGWGILCYYDLSFSTEICINLWKLLGFSHGYSDTFSGVTWGRNISNVCIGCFLESWN